MSVEIANEWLEDANGNRCSTDYFGTREKAQAALDSLKNCRNCTNCSRCSRCSDCSLCSGCSGCSDCSRCSRCSDCSRCSYCSDCSRCSDCSYCSDCSRCSDCSDCSRCSDCSYCSHVAYLYDKQDVVAQASAAPIADVFRKPPTPVIADIHQRVYEAATQPAALDMSTWHCGTTHCRAGWVVTLAGEEGAALERYFNTELAAMKIYAASGYDINPGRFFDGNEDALADMERLARSTVEAAAAGVR